MMKCENKKHCDLQIAITPVKHLLIVDSHFGMLHIFFYCNSSKKVQQSKENRNHSTEVFLLVVKRTFSNQCCDRRRSHFEKRTT